MNQIDRILDEIKKSTGKDLLYIRFSVLSGKSYYMKAQEWNDIVKKLDGFPWAQLSVVFGDIDAKRVDKNTILLVDKKNNSR